MRREDRMPEAARRKPESMPLWMLARGRNRILRAPRITQTTNDDLVKESPNKAEIP